MKANKLESNALTFTVVETLNKKLDLGSQRLNVYYFRAVVFKIKISWTVVENFKK